MTKEEFLDGLMKALASTGSQSLIAENIRFYSSYIDDELSKGRSIDEIMEELGEPRLIANSIKVAAGYDDVVVGIDNETYENTAGNYEENDYNFIDRKDNSFKTYNFSGNNLIIPIIIVIAVLVVIVAVVAAVFSFLAPVLLPVIGVLLLVAIIKGIFGKGNYKF